MPVAMLEPKTKSKKKFRIVPEVNENAEIAAAPMQDADGGALREITDALQGAVAPMQEPPGAGEGAAVPSEAAAAPQGAGEGTDVSSAAGEAADTPPVVGEGTDVPLEDGEATDVSPTAGEDTDAPPDTGESAAAPPDTVNVPPQGDPGAEEQAVNQVPVEAIDNINAETLNLARTTGDAAHTGGEEQSKAAGDPYFDPLPVKWKEASDDTAVSPDVQELKAEIGKLREGNLYQAVIVSRLLKDNKPNPMASGVVSRALNSSKWAAVTDLNAMAAGGVGMLSTFDKNATSQSVYQGISLVTNFITIVSTMRNMYLKVRKLQFKKSLAAWGENAFQMIGIVGDFAMICAKAVALAKTLATLSKKNAPILKKVSNWMFLATGTSQAIALLNTSRGLAKGCANLRTMEGKEQELWDPVSTIIQEEGLGEEEEETPEGTQEAGEGTQGGQQGEGVAPQENQGEGGAPQENQGGEQGEGGTQQGTGDAPQEAEGQNPPRAMDSWKKEKRILKAKEALDKLESRTDEDTERKKDILVQYLGFSKRISKQKHELTGLLATAMNCLVGIGSSLVTGGRFVTSEGTKRAKNEDRRNRWGTADQALGYTGMVAGAAANGMAMLSSGVKIGTRIANRGDERSHSVKARLLDKIDTLGQDEYGLKYLEDALVNSYAEGRNRPENHEEGDAVRATAAKVKGLYQGTQGMFGAMGVPVGQLIKAKDQEAFEKILISSMV